MKIRTKKIKTLERREQGEDRRKRKQVEKGESLKEKARVSGEGKS
jgi:hypothetical protein